MTIRTMMVHYLPHEIISDILFRLPFESLIPCKEVCRTWRDLLRHIKRAQKINFIFAREYHTNDMQLYHGEYDEKSNNNLHEQLSYNALTPLGYPGNVYSAEHRNYRPMAGSHRGLVCFYETHDNVHDPIIICNPFTRETVLLPYLPKAANGDFLVSGFGYLYATNEYKVVRVHYSPSRFRRGQVQVYTLGDNINGWRNKEDDLFLNNRSLSKSNGVLCNGALHWIDDMSLEIVCFDLADEKFRSIQLPKKIASKNDYAELQLLTLGGNLSVLFRRHSSMDEINIWSLKETKRKSSGCKYWRKECTIRTTAAKEDLYHPFAITEENKLLMFKERQEFEWLRQRRESTLCHYDPHTATLEEFDDNHVATYQDIWLDYVAYNNRGHGFVNNLTYQEFEDDYTKRFPKSQAIAYMKSDVRLKLANLPVVNQFRD